MLAKEKKELLRLRAENQELKMAIKKRFIVSLEPSWELDDLRIKIDLIQPALNGVSQ